MLVYLQDEPNHRGGQIRDLEMLTLPDVARVCRLADKLRDMPYRFVHLSPVLKRVWAVK